MNWKDKLHSAHVSSAEDAAIALIEGLDEPQKSLMNKDDVAGLVEDLRALHVWPQFVADNHAEILLPRQSKGLYGVGETAHRATDALTTLSAERDDLQHRLDNICMNIHTCSGDSCERPVCVERRKNTTLSAENERLRAALREVFLDGHGEGWRGNQTRRDVQHVDAEKSWSLYVSNGALSKTIARQALAGDTNHG